MKTIVNQLFIYFFLTTICGTISKSVSEKPVEGSTTDAEKTKTNDCNFRTLVSALNETIECKKRPVTDDNLTSKRNPLCTGIDEGVNEICQLHPNQTSEGLILKKTTDLVNEIKLPNLKNIDEFCNAMSEVTKNSLNVTATNKGELAGVVTKSHRLLSIGDCYQLCGTYQKTSIDNPLCPVLFWINRLLLSIKTSKTPINKQEPTGQKDSPIRPSQQTQENLQKNATADFKLSNKNSTPKTSSAPKTEDRQSKTSEQTNQQDKILKQKNQQEKIPKQTNQQNKPPEQSEPVNDIEDPQPPKLNKTPASVAQQDTAKGNTSANNQLDAKKATPLPEVIKDNAKTKDEDAAETLTNENGNAQGILEDPIMTDEETGLTAKDKLQNPNQSVDNTDGENVNDIEGRLPFDRDEDIDMEGPGETPDDNGNVIVAHSGPPEPPQHFFAYFMAISLTCLLCYIGYHKKQKIMAIVFEGRKSRGGRGRRRPNTASYRKLDCTLEEAVTSQCNSNVTHVIY